VSRAHAGVHDEPEDVDVCGTAYAAQKRKALGESANKYERAHGVHVEILAIQFDAYAAKIEAPSRTRTDRICSSRRTSGSARI